MAVEEKRKQVTQLLRDYLTWHAAFGGAVPLDDEAGVTEANYGPAGMVFEGAEFSDTERYAMFESMALLREALNELRREHFPRYSILKRAYIEDPGDWRVVGRWRERQAESDDAAVKVMLHDRGVDFLVSELKDKDLYPVFAQRLSEAQEKEMEARNAEIYALFQQHRVSGMNERRAAAHAARDLGIGTDTVERIVEFREHIKVSSCRIPECKRVPYQQGMCAKHYQRQYRKRKRAS